MSNRRDVLVGIGAGLGVSVLAFAAAGRRAGLGHSLEYGFTAAGAPVGSLAGQPLKCTAGTVTAGQGEGPFYSPKTPERRDIRDPLVGEALIVAGRVLDQQCRPIVGAVLDFWQTDHLGRYDNEGYRYRGHQRTDEAGRFELMTVRPHAYTAMSIFRTPHIHVKVQGANTRLLNTQLYLPDAEETNARDLIYRPELAIQYVSREGSAERAVFDFVLESA
jgi:protocatechuate 3,4-dioxygenase beta subunit